MKKLIGLILLSISVGIAAGPLAVVNELQQPTGVERNGVRSPLYPDTELPSGDLLQTGETGKLLLRFAEGSNVEIGSAARIRLNELMVSVANEGSVSGAAEEQETPSPSLFQAALDVLRGAFRFTTTVAGLGQRRSIDITVGEMATIGIRGTDAWGKAAPQGDFVVLIEGNISVDRQGSPTLRMDQPQTIYKANEAVTAVAPEDLRRWAVKPAWIEAAEWSVPRVVTR